ncbi:MAG: High molecular weight rubredoxin [Bacteroidetes bacterium]|nr:MAG: High molecular weight rubredoxin [Bacteroidota bacterium]
MNPKAYYKLTYGLYIISSKSGDKMNGYIANTAFQITAEPPQIAISCHKDNLSSSIIKDSGLFAISVLKQDVATKLIGTFGFKSGKNIDKFDSVDYKTGSTGIPIVTTDCVAWFECKLVQTVDVGSHILFIGEVVDNSLLDENQEPLTYTWYQTVKNGKAPKNSPTYQKPKELKETDSKSEFKKYECIVCNHIYDEAEGDAETGIPPGTRFEDLPDDWVCPTCGAEKADFEEVK